MPADDHPYSTVRARPERRSTSDFSRFAQRVLTAVGITAAVVVVLLLLRSVVSVLLLVFASILLAVILHGLASRLSERAPLSKGWALAVVLLGIIVVLGGAGWLLAPPIAAQVDELGQTLPRSLDTVRQYIEGHSWAAFLFEEAPAPEEVVRGEDGLWARITGVFSTALGFVASTLFILVLGVYFAASPGLYKRGIVKLVPLSRRARAREVLDALGEALWGWLTGTLISMSIIGLLTWLGLMLLGMPLALALGFIAGLLEFIPLIGPWVSAVPALLIALIDGPSQALYVGLLYLGIQQLEGNLVTPLVMRKAVSLPPALTLTATVLAGVLFGLPGVLLATPLAVVVMVLVRMLYIEDVLGDKPEEPAP